MMEFRLNINATLKDLQLIKVSLDISEPLTSVYKIFESDQNIFGIIFLNRGVFFRLLSKARFYELMRKQYMYELFSKRKIEFLFQHNYIKPCIILPDSISVLDATTQVLKRSELDRYEPIVVSSENDGYKLLDFNHLLLSNNYIQTLVMDLLKKADQFKKEVLRIAAHDLRNPISAIQGFAQLMVKDLAGNEKMTEYLGYISQSSFQMTELVNDLLGAAITEATGFSLNQNRFCIIKQIQTVYTSYKYQLDQKQQSIIFNTESKEILVFADRQKVSEIFSNLISNAIKYSDFNKVIVIGIKQVDGFIEIKVKDQGQGFTESDLNKMFGKFQRLSAQPTGSESSTGLGLYIVKRIIDLHNGTIDIDTKIGIGTTFTVRLPNMQKVLVGI